MIRLRLRPEACQRTQLWSLSNLLSRLVGILNNYQKPDATKAIVLLHHIIPPPHRNYLGEDSNHALYPKESKLVEIPFVA